MGSVDLRHAVKVVFQFYNTVLDEDYVESVWANVVDKEQGTYQLNNIPFFVTSYSLGDVVLAENEGGELVVKDLVEESGNSTIQIIMMQSDAKATIQQALEKLGCSWEESHLPDYFTINVPEELEYAPIKKYLQKQELKKIIGYREACLAHSK